jgi:hypothetical protein
MSLLKYPHISVLPTPMARGWPWAERGLGYFRGILVKVVWKLSSFANVWIEQKQVFQKMKTNRDWGRDATPQGWWPKLNEILMGMMVTCPRYRHILILDDLRMMEGVTVRNVKESTFRFSSRCHLLLFLETGDIVLSHKIRTGWCRLPHYNYFENQVSELYRQFQTVRTGWWQGMNV